MSDEAEIIATQYSESSARRLLDEIVSTGGYQAVDLVNGFTIYQRNKDGAIDEITIEKIGERKFTVTKRRRELLKKK